jgi:hypothetical protein
MLNQLCLLGANNIKAELELNQSILFALLLYEVLSELFFSKLF